MATERTPLSSKVRDRVLDRCEYECVYCGAQLNGMWHADHMISCVDDGFDTEGNLVAACIHCNLSKGGKSIDPLTVPRLEQLDYYSTENVRKFYQVMKGVYTDRILPFESVFDFPPYTCSSRIETTSLHEEIDSLRNDMREAIKSLIDLSTHFSVGGRSSSDSRDLLMKEVDTRDTDGLKELLSYLQEGVVRCAPKQSPSVVYVEDAPTEKDIAIATVPENLPAINNIDSHLIGIDPALFFVPLQKPVPAYDGFGKYYIDAPPCTVPICENKKQESIPHNTTNTMWWMIGIAFSALGLLATFFLIQQ